MWIRSPIITPRCPSPGGAGPKLDETKDAKPVIKLDPGVPSYR